MSILFSRRSFLAGTFYMLGTLVVGDASLASTEVHPFKGDTLFYRILKKADANNWRQLPIGELTGKIAGEFVGVPYVSNTLELSEDKEICSVNLLGLDCVTFFETSLDFARMLKKGGRSPDDLLKEVRLTRYRGGEVGDYTSRLHYTSDWFYDNQAKGVITLLGDLPGATPLTQKVGFISGHPHSYRQLAVHPELISVIQKQEAAINSRSLNFIPLDKIASIEPLLQTGDIVGVCTDVAGLDIAHTGLIYCDDKGVRHFMDASSKKSKMKVTIEDGPISQSLNWSKSLVGAMFARPLPVKSAT